MAGGKGRQIITPTYGLHFDGEILCPCKTEYAEKERLVAAYMHTVDVSWRSQNNAVLKRAGLDFWRVTTFHMHDEVIECGTVASGEITLAAAFGLAMRDEHRVFAGDFTESHHYISSILDELIEQKPEYSAVTYQYLPNPNAPEIGAVIFNYPELVPWVTFLECCVAQSVVTH